MRYSKQQKRREEIEQIALRLLIEKGYRSTSMLSVSTRADCSNETMYRWYGNKAELLADVIKRFRSELVKTLVLSAKRGGDSALTTMGAVLLEKATSLEGVALLRASLVEQDAHGLSGATAQRQEPIFNEEIKRLFLEHAQLLTEQDPISKSRTKDVVDAFLQLLVSDLPMRRAYGETIELSKVECATLARLAIKKTRQLYPKSSPST